MTARSLLLLFAAALAGAANVSAQSWCAPPTVIPKGPPPSPPPAVCQPRVCGKCTTSPCYVDSGIYVNDAVDLSIPTNGFPLVISRHYDSSVTVDGPLGIGWTSSLTPHLYYAVYLYAANVYQYEADVIMPDGVQYRFSNNGGGSFTPPAGRLDTLVRNSDGTFTMTLQRSRSTYSFAADGSLTAMTDDFGNAVIFTYDGNGRVQTVADASGSGRSLSVTWNPQGRIADVSDSSSPARHIVYTYGTDGTLTGVRDPITPSGQQSTSYTYISGRYAPVLSRIDDRWGRVVSRLTWQSDGKLASYTEGDFNDSTPAASAGEKYTYSYLVSSTIKTSSLGAISHNYTINGLITDHATYDGNGNVLYATDGAGTTTGYQYDARQNLSALTRGGMTWSYTYDANYPDQVSTVTPKDGNGNVVTNFPSWAYDYNLPGETAPGALKRVKRYNTTRTFTETLAEYAYDAKGHIMSATDDFQRVSTFAYDAAGNRISATVAGQTTTYGYDSMGRVISVTDAVGHVTSYTYDVLDRVLSVRLPRPSSTSALDFVTNYSYDNLDNGIVYVTVTDPNVRTTKSGYDALGHVVRTVDGLANTTQFTYQYNLLKSVVDANGNVTSYTYDVNRNLAATTFPDGAVETMNVAFDGTVLGVIDRRNIVTSYTRDGFGRIKDVSYSDNHPYPPATYEGNVTYTYDGERLASVYSATVGSSGTTMTFTYDDTWRIASETRAGEYTISYLPPQGLGGYTVTPAASVPGPTLTVNYFYDANKRLHQINGEPFGTFTIDYNALGQYSRITYPGGQTRDYTYDDQGRLTLLDNEYLGSLLARFQYDYDYNWSTNTYSMLGQRTGLTAAVGGPAPYQTQTKYAYDADYQLTTAIQAPNVYSYTYDAIGNRTSAQNVAYSYYKNGTNPLNGQRLRNNGGAADFTYDANGNMTGRTGSAFYAWDHLNRLTANHGTSYTYDYLNRRISTTTNGVTTNYVPRGLNTIRERTGTTVRDYIFAPGIDEPLAKIENGNVTNYSIDGLGSVVAETDNSGTILNQYAYDWWGGVSSSQPPLFGYTGRESATGGLWFLRARYYDPSIGRFISEDSYGTVADAWASGQTYPNLDYSAYGYAYNDPIKYVDPSGKQVALAPPVVIGGPAAAAAATAAAAAAVACYQSPQCRRQVACFAQYVKDFSICVWKDLYQCGPGHENTFDCKDRAWKNYALCRKYGPGPRYAPTFQ